MAEFNSTQPFKITVPDAALTTSNGEAIVDLTPDGIDAADLTLSNLSSNATARTNLSVPAIADVTLNSAPHPMGPCLLALDSALPIVEWRWRPGFAGTLTRVSMVICSDTIATGAATVVPAIAGVACTLGAPLSAPIASAPGFVVDTNISALGAFTADQEISLTPGGTNTASAHAGVMLEYTRT